MLANFLNEFFYVIAHQVQLMRSIIRTWMNSQFRWWQSEYQPTLANIYIGQLQNCLKELLIGCSILAVNNCMCSCYHVISLNEQRCLASGPNLLHNIMSARGLAVKSCAVPIKARRQTPGYPLPNFRNVQFAITFNPIFIKARMKCVSSSFPLPGVCLTFFGVDSSYVV